MRIIGTILLLLPATLGRVPTWETQVKTFTERKSRGSLRHRNETECHLNSENDCRLSDFKGEVVSVYPGGKTECMDPNSPYRFVVYPGATDRVLIYFQGGGACWNRFTSRTKSFCNQDAEEYNRGSFGVFERREPSNPYRDYTLVYVLYCSGDFHAGNTIHRYGDKSVAQKGAENTAAVFKWIKDQDWTLDKLVLMGGSAGSLGIQVYAGSFLTQLKYKKAAVVLDSLFLIDSNAPFYHKVFEKFNACLNELAWSWHPILARKCKMKQLSIDQVFVETMKAFPKVTFATVNSKLDKVQRLFYFLNLFRILRGKTYYRKLATQLREYNKQPNFVAYLVDGSEHDFTDWHEFYYTSTTGAHKNRRHPKHETIPLVDWIRKLPLDGNDTIHSQCRGKQVENLAHLTPKRCDRVLMQK